MIKIHLVLHNIRSSYNVGAILRTAECLGVEKVIYSGYTPRYGDDSLLPHLRAKLNRQIARVALGAEEMVPQETVQDLAEWLQGQKAAGWVRIGLENNLTPAETQRRLFLTKDTKNELLASVNHEKTGVVLVLGEEVTGIPAAIRPELDYFLEIPMVGQKESFNVSVAAGIALWGLMGN